ncbi:MAG: adenosine kinase [Alphaproteobacteria bacterium]
MTTSKIDVTGIGNAIVDVIAQADDAFLGAHKIPKGGMRLIDSAEAERLYSAMGAGRESSGGSVANSTVGVASLGGRAAYIGKVHDDQLGRIFAHDLKALGVDFPNPPAKSGPPTARSLILVTPDGERSMNTYLGACVELGPDDVAPQTIEAARITFLEGYLMDWPSAGEAFVRAADLAHKAGAKIALTLSDAQCVNRHRDLFRKFIQAGVDIVLANEDEIKALYEVATVDEALSQVRGECEVAAVTRSAAGSVVVSGGETHIIEAVKAVKVVDLTGAGDLYAAGFLAGLARGMKLADCGRLGSLAAAESISHFGARPEKPLSKLAANAGLAIPQI